MSSIFILPTALRIATSVAARSASSGPCRRKEDFDRDRPEPTEPEAEALPGQAELSLDLLLRRGDGLGWLRRRRGWLRRRRGWLRLRCVGWVPIRCVDRHCRPSSRRCADAL